MSIDAFAFSEPGRKKPNQDSVLVKEVGGVVVLAIADGMGGEKGGEVASRAAVDVVFNSLSKDPEESLKVTFMRVKRALDYISSNDSDLADMGTTLTVAVIKDNIVSVGHVGDTRLYHLRNNGIITRTKDQTEVQKLIDDGILSKSRARKYHRRNILLSVLSPKVDFDFQSGKFKLESGDKLVLMTDGAYSLVNKSDVRDSSVIHDDAFGFISDLKKKVLSKDIKDDYSAIVYRHLL